MKNTTFLKTSQSSTAQAISAQNKEILPIALSQSNSCAKLTFRRTRQLSTQLLDARYLIKDAISA
jgi:hypothetical protein